MRNQVSREGRTKRSELVRSDIVAGCLPRARSAVNAEVVAYGWPSLPMSCGVPMIKELLTLEGENGARRVGVTRFVSEVWPGSQSSV